MSLLQQYQGWIPEGVTLLETRYGGFQWKCDCGKTSTITSGSVEVLYIDHANHLNEHHARGGFLDPSPEGVQPCPSPPAQSAASKPV